ncbi:MAG: O-methyltransferase, partial [Lachnospiraceae bacterium]|nr:O-methyltransferase [Lachnospiraceae bacterium]
MSDNERLRKYLNSLEKENTPYLEAIRLKAIASYVPIIKKETESFLKVILGITMPKDILEIGTAVGYSALTMKSVVSSDTHITTIENYQKRIQIAKENFKKYDDNKQITLIEDDALEVLKKLSDNSFDFIFLDAAKGQYINYLPEIMRILRSGGVLLTDNVLQEGDIIESKFLIERRDRTIHK